MIYNLVAENLINPPLHKEVQTLHIGNCCMGAGVRNTLHFHAGMRYFFHQAVWCAGTLKWFISRGVGLKVWARGYEEFRHYIVRYSYRSVIECCIPNAGKNGLGLGGGGSSWSG